MYHSNKRGKGYYWCNQPNKRDHVTLPGYASIKVYTKQDGTITLKTFYKFRDNDEVIENLKFYLNPGAPDATKSIGTLEKVKTTAG